MLLILRRRRHSRRHASVIDRAIAIGYVLSVDNLVIEAHYDEDARVWVAVNDELGLATEAETLDVLTYKLQEMVPELAMLNDLQVSRPVRFTLRSVRRATAFA